MSFSQIKTDTSTVTANGGGSIGISAGTIQNADVTANSGSTVTLSADVTGTLTANSNSGSSITVNGKVGKVNANCRSGGTIDGSGAPNACDGGGDSTPSPTAPTSGGGDFTPFPTAPTSDAVDSSRGVVTALS